MIADAPDAPIEGMVLVDNDWGALIRGRSGALYRSEYGFERWTPTASALDEWEWRRRHPPGARVPGPLACLSTARQGRVAVHLHAQGCFSSTEGAFEARWDDGGGAVVVDLAAFRDRDRPAAAERAEPRGGSATRRTVAADEARGFAQRVATLIEAGDQRPSCGSTSTLAASLTWRCDAAAEQHADFVADDCGGDDGDEARPAPGRPRGLNRPFALLKLGTDVATQR